MDDKVLTDLLEPVLTSCGLELDAIEVVPAGKRRLLRVVVDGDGPQGSGPDLDQIAAATKAVSKALDESSADGNSPYTLEVSSRGISRPLTKIAHFRRNIGRLVKCEIEAEDFVGRISAVDETAETITFEDREEPLALADIAKATIQIEMNPPKKSRKKSRKKKTENQAANSVADKED